MKIKLFAVVVCCLAAVVAKASTTTPAATGQAKAEIITPVTLAHDEDATLNFGRMVVASAGTMVVPANNSTGAATPTGGVTVASGGDASSADHFTVSGITPATTYNVNLPESATLTHTTDNTKQMTVNAFTHNAGANSTASEFYVGATLNVAAGQTAGVYTGTYSVTITY